MGQGPWWVCKTVHYRFFAWLLQLALLLAPASALAFTSDDFHASTLDNGLWQIVDPRGDGSVSVNGTQLNLTVPGGVTHDVWTSGNNSLRVMQEIADTDLEAEVKFESRTESRYQLQGLLVEQDSDNFVRLDVHHDGSSLYIFAATFSGGQPDVHAHQVIGNAQPIHLRLTRTGSSWTAAYSYDGFNWTVAAEFTYTLNVSRIGPFAGNVGANPPSHTALVDFVFNTDSPIEPEDGGGGADTVAPAISGVTESVGDTWIDLSWTTNESAASVIHYGQTSALEAGTRTATSDSSGTMHSASVSGLVSGTTYYYQIEATDAAGNVGTSELRQVVTSSGASIGNGPEIDVWYGTSQPFGHNGQPQRWVNVLGNASDPDGVNSITYSLNGGSEQPLSLGPNDRRLEAAGDFNADIAFTALASGSNDVTIRATDALGNTSSASVTVNKVDGITWALPTTIDWGGAASIADAAQVVDGHWTLEGDTVRPQALGYDRLIAFGDMAWKDYEVVVPVTIHSLDPDGYDWPSNGPGVGLIMRWTGHHDWGTGAQPHDGWWPLGALGWYRWPTEDAVPRFEMIGNEGHWLDTNRSPLDFGVPYYFKMRVETPSGQGSIYRLKAWRQSDPEPTTWDLEAQEETTDPQFGSAALVAHHVDASFGDVTVNPIDNPAADTTPPSISGVGVVTGQTSAEVSWSTDEPANSAVRYGETTEYELGTVTGSNLVSSHGVWLSNLAPATQYHFQVQSMDAAGNTAVSGDYTFTTDSDGVAAGVTDTFDGDTLDTSVWTLDDPVGDSAVYVSNGELHLAVAGGTEHDVWSDGVNAPRVMQSVDDSADMVVEARFNSVPSEAFQLQGILVEQNPGTDFLRFDYYFDGTSLRVFGASFANGRPTVRHNTAIAEGSVSAPLYLRVTRSGDTWTHEYSQDGEIWETAGSFDHPLVVTRVGPFAGNAGSNAPAFEARVDYFSFGGTAPDDTPDTTGPVISGVTMSAGETSVGVGWSTDEPATSVVRYGETTNYELGIVSDGTYVTTHDVRVSGLTSGTSYHYRIESTDQAGNTSAHEGTVSTATSGGGTPGYADEFDTDTLGSAWTVVDPVGDSAVSVSSGRLEIAVAGGASHDVWKSGVDAPRIVRPVSDDSTMSVEVKFDSVPTEAYQLQGVLLEETSGSDFLRFDFYSDGGSLRAFAATFVNGRPTVQYNEVITSGMTSGPLYLRVSRDGDSWLQEYSYDGVNWQSAGSFVHSQGVSGLAIFAGNAGSNPPAFNAVIDYVR